MWESKESIPNHFHFLKIIITVTLNDYSNRKIIKIAQLDQQNFPIMFGEQ